MIGFTLDASSPSGFKQSRNGWTEGSLWLLKKAIDASQNKVANIGAQEALLDAMEGDFKKIKDSKFDQVAISGLAYRLMVSIAGGSFFTYDFVEKKNADIVRFELAKKIANMKEPIGDQVATAMFQTIVDFQSFCLFKDKTSLKNNFLHIQIAL